MKTTTNDESVRAAVRDQYGAIAREGGGCGPACCGPGASASLALGYTEADIASVPDGANMGLGCGNPQAIASLREGEVVIDLGSGGGFDCFLASRQVGPSGAVIGVDMTADMVAKARANAAKLGASNVDFRLGEIEHLPVSDGAADVILSNCVVNLSPDKAAVFAEAFRALKPGGRLAISDVVAVAPLPSDLAADVHALTGCVSGAVSVSQLVTLLADAGFERVDVAVKEERREFISDWMPGSGIERYVASATIRAQKPLLGASREPSTSKPAGACCAPSCCAGQEPA
jgi:arsenite methyltransferase